MIESITDSCRVNLTNHVGSAGDDGHRKGDIRHDGEVHLPRTEERLPQTARGGLLPGTNTSQSFQPFVCVKTLC